MSKKTRILSALLALVMALGICFISPRKIDAAERDTKTAIGLAEFGMNAYRDEWYYVYGCYGQVGESGHRLSDCSGLVYAYLTWDEEENGPVANGYTPRGATAQYFNCSERGSIDSMPRTHGLLVFFYNGWDCSHVGIYVGGGYAVDNSYYGTNMIHGRVSDNAGWTAWGKLDSIEYPTDGWYSFDGKPFFYIDGEYAADAIVTIDGEEYSFDSNGNPSPAPADFEIGSGEVDNYIYNAPGKTYKTAVTSDIEMKLEAHPESPAVCKVADGTKITVKDSRDENWYKVSLPGEIVGYVETHTLRNTVGEIGTATADLAVRAEASADAASVAGIYSGDHVAIIDTSTKGWFGVELDDGTKGYVVSEYMDVELAVTNTGIGNIRKSADNESEIIKTIASGEVFTLLHINESWAKIRLENGTTGFVPAVIIEYR